ncbi:MAG TPA: D-2-hydroxyacid dehydrogenase [Thermomicrobiales bacterium]|jgi:phosphoglycerate dehydrogenase-like enzyme
MGAQDVFVVVNVPASIPENLRRALVAAHPRAEVALVDDPEQFAELLPRANGAMILPPLSPLLPPALVPEGRLRWLHSVPAGAEGLLTPEVIAAEHIMLTASKGPMGPMVAEHALLLMLALARDLPGYAQNQAARRWHVPTGERPMRDLFGKTVLILGVGGIGGHLARMCRVGLQMRVLGTARTRHDDPHVERYVAPPDLPAALGEADFVVLCLALTAETRGIIDAAALAAMRPTAYLVNVARGGLVDEAALVAALQAGRIAGAGLDSFATEPLPSESPLWAMPNVIITPHVANGQDSARDQVIAFMCENIRRFAEREPLLGQVDRQARY